jgi:protein TonB
MVDRDGSLVMVKLHRGLDKRFDPFALQIVQSMPKWIPARKDGVPVRQKLVIPIDLNPE